MNFKYLIVAFFFSAPMMAQNMEQLSPRACIDFAMKNQPKIKSSLLDEQIQLEKNKEILGIACPDFRTHICIAILFNNKQ